jgi:predicted esterase
VSGRADRAVPPDHPEALKKALENAGADVVLAWIDADHEISNRDLSTVTAWFEHLVNEQLEPTSRQE